MSKTQWVRDNRHRAGRREEKYGFNYGLVSIRDYYQPVFVLPLGSTELTITCAHDNYADGFELLLSTARLAASDPTNELAAEFRHALKLLGERNA